MGNASGAPKSSAVGNDSGPYSGLRPPQILTLDEIDIIRGAINKLLKVGSVSGSKAVDVDTIFWPFYKMRLEQIRESIRIGPPDERSKGL